ncbi:MAG: hypothetical protein JWO83_5112 [Caulobacteraceae bacterium]|jgi:hypothetical protein|nr:hypothetical protein [Caulobacteraceae bacterium]
MALRQGGVDPQGSSVRSRTFFVALALATAIPLVVLPFYGLSHWLAPTPLLASVFAVWILTGYGHVMSTVWFGADPDYRPVVRANRWRILGSLAAVPAVMGVLTVASTTVSAWLYAGFLAWQAHHYSRQNYGILSFAAVNDRVGPLPKQVSLIINLTSAAGAIGMVLMPTIYPVGLPRLPFLTPEAATAGRVAAIGCLVAAAVLIGRLLITEPRLRGGPRVLLFLGLSWAFFLPGLLSGAPQMTFWPYAMAHGAQYLIIMGITSRRSPRGWFGFALFAASAGVLGPLVFHPPGIVLIQAYTGVIIWHFLADARLWRLRDPTVRAIVSRRFDFLFGTPQGATGSRQPASPTVAPAVQ